MHSQLGPSIALVPTHEVHNTQRRAIDRLESRTHAWRRKSDWCFFWIRASEIWCSEPKPKQSCIHVHQEVETAEKGGKSARHYDPLRGHPYIQALAVLRAEKNDTVHFLKLELGTVLS